jgi:hypothetical protein
MPYLKPNFERARAMTNHEILTAVAAGKITPADAAGMLRTGPAQPLRCKVSAKKAVSVYGLQRMPVTLYAEQWERLVGFAPQLVEFIKANSDKLSRKAG